MKPGEELPSLTVPITRTLIIAGAIASRDYQDVHHDAEAARAKGTPDIFMNILTTNGLVGRYVTDYVNGRLGRNAILRRVSIRLGVPSYPGDVLVLTGRILSVDERAIENECVIEISVAGTNRLGRHVTATVEVASPASPAPPASRTAP
ncbi:acyl dehydratase [Streptomyces klenkii]|uniref:acyl dehydratase n=1 Tax=Streptomyces klenkii TaxID=1420899 RepID=UPI0036E5BCFC